LIVVLGDEFCLPSPGEFQLNIYVPYLVEPAVRPVARRPISRRHEPIRDWSYAFLTGHRIFVTVGLLCFVIGLYLLQDFVWPVGQKPTTLLDQIWSWLSIVWLCPVLPVTIGLVGLFAYRHPAKLNEVKPIDNLVVWRIVSRGTNREALLSTIKRCQREMRKTPLFSYIVEVVVDGPDFDMPQTEGVYILRVPNEYRTPNRTRFKARALHYAVKYSPIPDDAWIVHLDEETQPTSSGIRGICAMIREEETSNQLRIGQGALLYHRDWHHHPVLTLADNIRTGDDFARFYFQDKIAGRALFGLHGSYIVVRNDVEKYLGGFDFGPQGDITEDAYWALIAMQDGWRVRWVEGYLEEQSTQSATDFIKQRRRWFQGLAKVALHAPVNPKWRVMIGINTVLWCMNSFAMLYTIGHLFHGLEVRPLVRFLANYSFAGYGILYIVGLKANLDEHGIFNPLERLGWYFMQVVFLPFISALECLGVLAAVFQPTAGFHVVKK
jgi:egghead protein (zeste-white 4 protein)